MKSDDQSEYCYDLRLSCQPKLTKTFLGHRLRQMLKKLKITYVSGATSFPHHQGLM
jgi:hypothetical protein